MKYSLIVYMSSMKKSFWSHLFHGFSTVFSSYSLEDTLGLPFSILPLTLFGRREKGPEMFEGSYFSVFPGKVQNCRSDWPGSPSPIPQKAPYPTKGNANKLGSHYVCKTRHLSSTFLLIKCFHQCLLSYINITKTAFIIPERTAESHEEHLCQQAWYHMWRLLWSFHFPWEGTEARGGRCSGPLTQ